jgi:hypothetical protein
MQNVRAEARTSSDLVRLQLLTRVDRRLAREVLLNPLAPAALLTDIFSKYPDLTTQAAVIKHPNCPIELLAKSGARYPQALWENQALPLLLLENPDFLSTLSLYSLGLGSRKLPSLFIDWMLEKKDPKLDSVLAKNHSLSTSQVERLLERQAPTLYPLLSKHPNAPAWFLQHIAWGVVHSLRLAVAQNEASPPTLLLQMVQHESNVNTKTPLPPNPPNASTVQSKELRRALAKNPSTPREALLISARDFDPQVRFFAAIHEEASEEAVLTLAVDQDSMVRRGVLSRRRLSSSVIALFSQTTDPEETRALASRPETPPSLLAEIYARSAIHEPSVSTPSSITLRSMFNTSKERLLHNPSVPVEVLSEGAGDDSVVLRLIAAKHPEAPVALLQRLAFDMDAKVREAVARRPETPKETLALLCADESRLVRCRAQKHPSAPSALLRLLYQAGASSDLSSIGIPRRELTQKEQEELRALGPFASRLVTPRRHPPKTLQGWLWKGFQQELHKSEEVTNELWHSAANDIEPQIISLFLNHESAFVRARVAINPALSLSQLQSLLTDPCWFIRAAVIGNPSCTPALAVSLLHDPSAKVRRLLATHPHLTAEARNLLMFDAKRKVRRAALSTISFLKITRRCKCDNIRKG